MSPRKWDSKDLAFTFFENESSMEKVGNTITRFKCNCGVVRTQNLKKGFTNLISHIKEQHPDWEDIMQNKLDGRTILNQFINRKAIKIFNWLEWIVMGDLPFSFVGKTLIFNL